MRWRSGIWRRQLLSLLGCRWRCAGAHCSTNRCMGQAVRDGLRASKPAVYACFAVYIPRHVIFESSRCLGAFRYCVSMSPGAGAPRNRKCDELGGCGLYGIR